MVATVGRISLECVKSHGPSLRLSRIEAARGILVCVHISSFEERCLAWSCVTGSHEHGRCLGRDVSSIGRSSRAVERRGAALGGGRPSNQKQAVSPDGSCDFFAETAYCDSVDSCNVAATHVRIPKQVPFMQITKSQQCTATHYKLQQRC